MNRFTAACLSLTFSLLVEVHSYAEESVRKNSADVSPLRLGTDRYLFIDDANMREMTNTELIVNPPTMRSVVIPPEWGEVAEYTSVVDDDSGTYKFYYFSTEGRGFMALATSRDGLTWEKPSLGLIEHNGSKDNNYVIERALSGSVYYDPRDPNPNYRYKYLSEYAIDNEPNTPTTEGVVLYTSLDGIHFSKHDYPLFPGVRRSYRSESQAVLLYDPTIKKYVAFLRGYIQGDGERRRSILRAETDDPLKPWPFWKNPKPYYMDPEDELPFLDRELETVVSADLDDPPNTDMYNCQVFLYPRAPRTYLAFPTWYYHYSKDRAYLRKQQLDHRPDVVSDFNVGVGEVQLMTSRDGRIWTRYRQTPYIKHGWWGDHYAYWPWLYQGMILRSNKIYQYGTLRVIGHGGIEFARDSNKEFQGVVVFEQLLDRFAGIRFDYTGGRIITDPIVFEGNRLVLNVDTGGMGEGRVGIIRADGTRLPGYDVEDCDIINGDWLDKTVSWKRGNRDAASLAGQPVCLVFEMRHATLYGMQFQQSSEPNDPNWHPHP